jgi:hypothetical protein
LLLASRIPIKRHVKVRGEANPYDPAYETYFEKREGDHTMLLNHIFMLGDAPTAHEVFIEPTRT